MDFEHSERARAYIDQVERFVRERVVPNEKTYVEQLAHSPDWRQWRIPPILEELKAEAKALGLWNLFLFDAEYGAGLDNRDYAPIAEITGKSFLAPEVFNCSAPDTGNAEVLVKYGSPEQKERFLAPLLEGTIRSGFAMTEPAVASSDARPGAAADAEGRLGARPAGGVRGADRHLGDQGDRAQRPADGHRRSHPDPRRGGRRRPRALQADGHGPRAAPRRRARRGAPRHGRPPRAAEVQAGNPGVPFPRVGTGRP
jgi:hypothetical protein